MQGEVFFFVALMLAVLLVMMFRTQVKASLSAMLLGVLLTMLCLMSIRIVHDASSFATAFCLSIGTVLYFFGVYRFSPKTKSKPTDTVQSDPNEP